jgi:hypothetical protein
LYTHSGIIQLGAEVRVVRVGFRGLAPLAKYEGAPHARSSALLFGRSVGVRCVAGREERVSKGTETVGFVPFGIPAGLVKRTPIQAPGGVAFAGSLLSLFGSGYAGLGVSVLVLVVVFGAIE